MSLKDKAETLTDKLLDMAQDHPMSWVILIVYGLLWFVFGAVVF